ncbi:superoxide dismutase [Dactylonectria macrodidyma]|uniref:superoxide dismutase n=1 Tax=Dactylonectria macrodidyma TaxID=307937 RepID=A0A9P9FQP0_9HYPO|nr:superoxide dismutase [Dactylonectria macrodidyma]
MRSSAVLAALSMAFVSHVAGQNAEPVTDNPVGVVYKATLPEEPFFKNAALDGNVKGFITAMAAEDGHGVRFKVKFENLPKEGGPFLYHLHVDPAPDGNCTKTLAHLDPFERGEETPCDSSDTASCQVGDLSGKHGNIGTDPFELEYTDYFASTKEGIGAFFGNRSFVLHYANKTRLTCADFVRLEDAAPPPSNETYTLPPLTTPTPSKTMVTTPSATGTPSTTGVLELPSSTATGIPSTASSNMLSASFLVTGITLLLAFL